MSIGLKGESKINTVGMNIRLKGESRIDTGYS